MSAGFITIFLIVFAVVLLLHQPKSLSMYTFMRNKPSLKKNPPTWLMTVNTIEKMDIRLFSRHKRPDIEEDDAWLAKAREDGLKRTLVGIQETCTGPLTLSCQSVFLVVFFVFYKMHVKLHTNDFFKILGIWLVFGQERVSECSMQLPREVKEEDVASCELILLCTVVSKA